MTKCKVEQWGHQGNVIILADGLTVHRTIRVSVTLQMITRFGVKFKPMFIPLYPNHKVLLV